MKSNPNLNSSLVHNELNEINNFFKGLTFKEDTHSYFLNGKKLKLSVSGVIKTITPEFDVETVSRKYAEKRNLSQEEVKKSWKTATEEACEEGTKDHLFGELYPFDNTLKPKNKKQEAIVKFWNDLPDYIVPVTTEIKMYHKVFLFAGTADILLYNKKTKNFIIGDYKTNKDLFKNFANQKLLKPFENILNNPINKYTLQLSLYQILLEQTGVSVENRVLIHLLPDGNYVNYFTKDVRQEVKKILKIYK